MLKKKDLPVKNEFGDNGWFKIGPQAVPHFYHRQVTLCGVTVTSGNRNHLLMAEDNLHYCQNCIKVRRNRLRARYNQSRALWKDQTAYLLDPKSHSPKKPQ